ncbi:MAG: hypothetical protein HGA44_05760 [Cellulomonadaceae bacterium]|nr:hypothetical protein [Cellulomonadaceae bacterium]
MSGRHAATKAHHTRQARTVLAVAGLAGIVALTSGASTTGATWRDIAAAQMVVTSTRWATDICVIQSVEDVDGVFALRDHAPMSERGWTSVVDKRTATSTADLAGCGVLMIAGELWGPSSSARALARAWFAQGGSVLSTGNDAGQASYPYPEMIAEVKAGDTVAHFPYGGSVPAALETRAQLDPAFPSWTPAPGFAFDEIGAWPVTQVADDAVCVGSVTGHPQWCAAIAKTNTAGGRWVHLHTKVGTNTSPGDAPAADAALAWLAVGNL